MVLIYKPIIEPQNTTNIQHDPPFTIKIKEKRCAFQLKSHSFNFHHHKRAYPVLSSILQHRRIITKLRSGYYFKLCPQLFLCSILIQMLASVNQTFRFLPHWVLSINGKLPPSCSVEREKLIFFNGKNRKSKPKNKKQKQKKPYLGYNICYFVEGHIGYCLPLVKTSLFADWKCVVIAISYIVQWFLIKWI